VEVPGSRLEEALQRVLRQAPPMVFPGAPAERVAILERDWWRDRVRATFRAADGMVRFRDFEVFFAALFAHFASPRAWAVAPGAHEALAQLRGEGRRIGVVSNFDQRLPDLLEGLGLSRWLSCIVLPCHAGAAKPDRRIFAAALTRLGAQPDVAVYLGDDPERDLEAARGAGLHAIDVAGLATLAELPGRIASLEETRA
jgi:putative hydrolase of the HAD superfamily